MHPLGKYLMIGITFIVILAFRRIKCIMYNSAHWFTEIYYTCKLNSVSMLPRQREVSCMFCQSHLQPVLDIYILDVNCIKLQVSKMREEFIIILNVVYYKKIK